MALKFLSNGNLEPGIHLMTLEDFKTQFGYNARRQQLISGLILGMDHLRDCGCQDVYVDGSFVTTKEVPGDFDACWDFTGVDLAKVKAQYPALWTFSKGRELQKKIYQGEFFPYQAPASPTMIYMDFFQQDKDGNPKGIVQLNLK